MKSDFEEFRVLEVDGHWEFQVGVVDWPQPHTPETRWVTFRKWKRPATESRIALAKEAARREPRFFRSCTRCGELNNAGHMHDRLTCQACAERYLEVVY